MDDKSAAAIGDLLGEQMNELQKMEELTRAKMAAAGDDIGQQREQMLKAMTARMSRGSPLAWPPKVVAIANTLTLQPRLVDAVDLFLQRLVKKINLAVDQAVAESIPDLPPSSPPAAPGP